MLSRDQENNCIDIEYSAMKNEKMNGNYVIGLDFGTLSARAVLVSVTDGVIKSEAVFNYPHKVITDQLERNIKLDKDYALADPIDYRTALTTCIKSLVQKSKVEKEKIIGIGIAATTYSMVPCYNDGTALAEQEKNRKLPMAYIKLWKHHGAVPQAEKIAAIHKESMCFQAIEHYGGVVNCEWGLPKILETFEKSPFVASEADCFCDLGEWIAWLLVGKRVCSLYTAGFKGMYLPQVGYPSKESLNLLAPNFGDFFYDKVVMPVSDYLSPCGFLSKKAADKLGLIEGIPVATPMGDGSMPGIYFCINDPACLAITVGTSVAMAFVREKLVAISGINGVVKDGIIPGYFAYDAGQPCAGDMLEWFTKKCVPKEYYYEAEQRNCNIHQYLSLLADSGPQNCRLTVLDWFNGNRSILNNPNLKGSILGLSLDTKPENIYCAMVQGIACGMRIILEHLAQNGIVFDRIIACGGIVEKNKFVRKQYANIIGKPIYISTQRNITSLGSATLASIATGVTFEEAGQHMCNTGFDVVEPDENIEEYNAIYERYCYYHNLLKEK